MEAVSSSEMLVATYEATLCHNKIQNRILMQELHTEHCHHIEFPDILKHFEASFDDTVSCWDCTASMIGYWMNEYGGLVG
jgi:hypothetical protein